MKTLLIRSSSNPDEPYKMQFAIDGDRIKLRCYCPAGTTQMLCKHVTSLLAGDRTILFPACDPALFDEALVVLTKIGAVDHCRQMTARLAELDREYKKAKIELKEKLCGTLRDGGSFV